MLEQALAIEERVYGPTNRYVASALNDLGKAALQQNKFDVAEARFTRMVEIYRSIYNNHHYLIGIALSNLASVSVEKKDYARAEQIYRNAIEMFSATLPANHLNTAIAQIKLGRVLVRERRYQEAEGEILTGYRTLMKQSNPSGTYVQAARKDLVTVYDALNQPEKANEFRNADTINR